MTARTETRYDLWRCAQCGRELTIPSLPCKQPTCCGTMMWWQRIEEGPSYNFDPEDTQ